MDNKELYRSFCEQNHNLPIFWQPWWLDAACDDWNVVLAYNGDKVSGVWPYMVRSKVGVNILQNPILTPYLGPQAIYPHDLKETKRDNFEHEAISNLYNQLPELKVWSLALMPNFKQAGFFKNNGFDVHVRQTFIMPLEEGDAVFNRLHEDYRRNVRKADKEMQIADEPEMLEQLYNFQKATLDRKGVGLYYPFTRMKKIFDACKSHNSTALWVARKEGEVQAILWQVWDEERAYYLVGGKNPQVNDTKAMTGLIWHAIKHAIAVGKKAFDFEGSMDAGVEKFFRNFGGDRTLYLSLKKNDSLLWRIKEKLR